MSSTAPTAEQKGQRLFLFLCGLFLTNALIAEIIGTKIFSVETVLAVPPARIALGGQLLDFNMSAGVLNWPVVFITSDLINEYFGRRGVRRISFLTAGFIVYMFGTIYATTLLPPAQFWLDLNRTDAAGNALNINEAFSLIFRQGLGIMIGSIVAFLLGQLLDISVFSWLRRRTGPKHIWLKSYRVDALFAVGGQFRRDRRRLLHLRELEHCAGAGGGFGQLHLQSRRGRPDHAAPVRGAPFHRPVFGERTRQENGE